MTAAVQMLVATGTTRHGWVCSVVSLSARLWRNSIIDRVVISRESSAPCGLPGADRAAQNPARSARRRPAGGPGFGTHLYDDQRCVRRHVAVFVNQQMVQDRVTLEQPVQAGDRVLVVQALSGG